MKIAATTLAQGLGLGYPVGAAILGSLLIAVFAIWRLLGLTFTITKINTFRGEALFWTAILISNTLGTSVGDFLSDSTGLGYVGGALLISGVLLHRPVLARVRPRPSPRRDGGGLPHETRRQGRPGLGTIGSSAVLFAALIGLVVWSSVREHRSRTLLGPLPELA